MYHVNRLFRDFNIVTPILMLALLCTIPASIQAKLMETRLPNRLLTKAEFARGDPGKPAVLLLHGFLQTHNSSTLARLTQHIGGEGYTVLAPTLSLGVSDRKQSLACEAIHTHKMQDDIAEIRYWVDWLTSRGFKEVVIVGHSYGSLELLVYMANNSNKAVRKVIATSLVDFDRLITSGETRKQVQMAKRKISMRDDSLGSYRISYCNKYVSPPQSYLSYAKWTKPDILKLTRSIDVPLHIIIGSQDKRVDSNWPRMLKRTGAEVIMVQGANHFFDAEYEFDLADAVLSLLETRKR